MSRATATVSPAKGDDAPGHPGVFDDGILGLPLYGPGHVDLARRISQWCGANAARWATESGARSPEQTVRALLGELARDGWLSFLDPAGSAAADGDFRSICLIREALAYTADLADFAFSIQALSALPLLRHGSEEQQQRYLAEMAAGTIIGSFAISEEEAGSDVAAVGLRAERVAGGHVLNGHKAWIANGTIADLHCVIARTGEGPGVLGLTAFLVPAATEGLRVGATVPMLAPRAFGNLAFEDCYVPDDCVLGRCGGGFVIAMDLLDRFRMTVGAAALGFARRAADAALDRARNRRIYGGRLFDLQMVKATLADIDVKLDAAALLVARAAWSVDHDDPMFTKHSSTAKLYATEAAQEIVDAAVQVFGAAGLVEGSLTEMLYRQIRSLRIYEGASEVQKMVIAGALGSGRVNRRR